MDGHGQIHGGGASVEETAERNSRILPRMARAISARMHWPSASPRSQPDAQTAKTKRLSVQRSPWLATATTERRARKRRLCSSSRSLADEGGLMTLGGVSCKALRESGHSLAVSSLPGGVPVSAVAIVTTDDAQQHLSVACRPNVCCARTRTSNNLRRGASSQSVGQPAGRGVFIPASLG